MKNNLKKKKKTEFMYKLFTNLKKRFTFYEEQLFKSNYLLKKICELNVLHE